MEGYLAYYDILFLSNKIQNYLGDVRKGEIHLISYLSCLLFLYNENPISEWGYSYVATDDGLPFSSDIENNINEQIAQGFLTKEDEKLKISKSGVDSLIKIKDIKSLQERQLFLEGASKCLLVKPIGILRSALFEEPGLRSARDISQKKILLDQFFLDALYDHFSDLRRVIVDITDDLFVPAAIWLSYLENSAIQRNLDR